MISPEVKNKQIGIAVSIGVHALLLLLFLLLMAWRAPNPPHPEYGIEMNFGLDNQGSGEIQPENPSTSDADKEQDALPEEESSTENNTKENVAENNPTPKVENPDNKDQVDVPETESPVSTDEKNKKTAEELKKSGNNPKDEIKKGASGETGKTNESAMYGHGDDADKKGDKGDEKGKLENKALYGKPGGGAGGASLDMAGWMWDNKPQVKDESSEGGRIEIEIKIDSEGEIVSTRKVTSTVSPEVYKLYEDEVRKLTFSKTSSTGATATYSTGKITFLIRSK
jgi:periplasmic protein TonB